MIRDMPAKGAAKAPSTRDPGKFYSARNVLFAFVISFLYLLLAGLLIGFKTEQLILVAFFNAFYFFNAASRRFIKAFSIFIIYWIVFDFMKAFPNYEVNDVHVKSLYNWEKKWFGFDVEGQRVTPNEFFQRNHWKLLDILSGLFYICWVPVPLAFALTLYFKHRAYYYRFAIAFLLVNMIGFIGYYVYPAAPPWYVAMEGFEFKPATAGNTAALARFDTWLGIPVFHSLYAKSSNVFAAMPSLHAAYPLVVVFYAHRINWRRWQAVGALLALGIWFAAVYTSHHYLLDVWAGALCATGGILLVEWWYDATQDRTTGRGHFQKGQK